MSEAHISSRAGENNPLNAPSGKNVAHQCPAGNASLDDKQVNHLPFWVVVHLKAGLQIKQAGNPGNPKPTHFYRHETREKAVGEMQRLAVKFRGERFAIMECQEWLVLEPEMSA